MTGVSGHIAETDDTRLLTPASATLSTSPLPVVVSDQGVQVLNGELVVETVGVLDGAPVGHGDGLLAVTHELLGQAFHDTHRDAADGGVLAAAHGKGGLFEEGKSGFCLGVDAVDVDRGRHLELAMGHLVVTSECSAGHDNIVVVRDVSSTGDSDLTGGDVALVFLTLAVAEGAHEVRGVGPRGFAI